jgi:diguanylate cyclase (GGDEF)-like protein
MPNIFHWKKLTIVKKMLAGFIAMAFISFAALAISFTGLYSLHKTAKIIARHDLMLIISVDALRDLLQDQDSLTVKFETLKSPVFINQFQQSKTSFLDTLKQIQPDMLAPETAVIPLRYEKYCKLADRLFAGDNGAVEDLRKVSTLLSADLNQFEAQQRILVNKRLKEADQREYQTVGITLALSLTGYILTGIVALLITFNISKAMDKLKKATNRIAEGDFDYDPRISEGDEIGDLAMGFTHMAARLKDLEQHSLDASPLTRLPGNIAIERALNRKLQTGETFAFCYADLDNFKAYNDCYGYLKASEVIKFTGQIIHDSVSQQGSDDDFVGHIGGDDFVMVVDQETAESCCQTIIDRFSRMIEQNYSPEDLAAGCIQSVDRYGEQRNFPIMTISIAVLICGHGEYESAMDIARTAAEIKEHVKGLPGSNYLVNRRRNEVSRSSEKKA